MYTYHGSFIIRGIIVAWNLSLRLDLAIWLIRMAEFFADIQNMICQRLRFDDVIEFTIIKIEILFKPTPYLMKE